MRTEDCFSPGFIARPHGVKGEVRAVFDVDDLNPYKKKTSVFLEIRGVLTLYHIRSFKVHVKKEVIISFKGIDYRDQAEAIKGATIWLPLAELPPLSGNQFYYHEILGFAVMDAQSGEIGIVTGHREMPGQDLIFVDHKGTEVLIPVTDEIVLFPDREKKILYVNLPEGLLEVYVPSKKEIEEGEGESTAGENLSQK